MNTNPVSEVLQRCTTQICGFNDLILLVNGIIKYGIQIIGICLVLVLIYTGFLYLTSGGDTSKVKKARDMLYKVMWGLIYTLCGWLIVYFVLKGLGVNTSFYDNILSV